MKLTKLNLLITVGLVLLLAVPAQSQYVKTLGGTNDDWGHSVIEASDGGLVVTGQTRSFGAGAEDIIIAKFDASGNPLWATTLGGSDNDKALSVTEASDGGFVVAGWTYSYGAGDYDLLLAKFDASGSHLWTKTLGGTGYDYGYSVIEVSGGGLVVTGYTNSFGAGGEDLLLAKFDASGNHQWTKVLGKGYAENGRSVIEASDGGLVVGGVMQSSGYGTEDFLLTKFDASGNHLWTKTLGGNQIDVGLSVTEALDGGLVLTGHTSSFDAGDADILLTKLDSSGTLLWARTLGGTSYEQGECVIHTSDGGFVATGITHSFGVGGYDLILAKLDASGDHLWTRILSGGATEDRGYSVIQTSFGGIVAVGATYSFGAGSADILLARFDTDGNTCIGEFVSPEFDSISPDTSSPNPTVSPWSPTITSPNPTVTSPDPTLTVVCDETVPSIISISDVGNDQGKQARVNWHRCSYDEVGSPITITEYSLWRRIDEDKADNLEDKMLSSNTEIFSETRLYPPGDWDFIKTVPARGETTYNTVCPTLGDSTYTEGMYWSVFFVSAVTSDPLVYWDSEPDSGYSLDNIPPIGVKNLDIPSKTGQTLLLTWMVPGEYPGEQPATAYDIRYSTSPIDPDTTAWWNAATQCQGEPYPALAGQIDSFMVTLDLTQTYYFAMKLLDDRPNYSEISNIVRFQCGDANGDTVINSADIVFLINYLFVPGSPPPDPKAVGDVNCDGVIDSADIVYLINFLFVPGSPPPCA